MFAVRNRLIIQAARTIRLPQTSPATFTLRFPSSTDSLFTAGLAGQLGRRASADLTGTSIHAVSRFRAGAAPKLLPYCSQTSAFMGRQGRGRDIRQSDTLRERTGQFPRRDRNTAQTIHRHWRSQCTNNSTRSRRVGHYDLPNCWYGTFTLPNGYFSVPHGLEGDLDQGKRSCTTGCNRLVKNRSIHEGICHSLCTY